MGVLDLLMQRYVSVQTIHELSRHDRTHSNAQQQGFGVEVLPLEACLSMSMIWAIGSCDRIFT